MKEESEKKTPVWSVTELTNAIKVALEQGFPAVVLEGEISNFKKQSSGHLYFSLKDAHAQIQAVMFKGQAEKLRQLPKDGDNVIVKGELNVYPPHGKYQLLVKELQHVGIGDLLIKLEELKRKIQKKGWFKAEHKKPLPTLPKRIGVVTSPTGAAIQDILNVLTRRFAGVHVILNPVRVQGSEAPAEIAQAIRQFNDFNLADVIIVGRGGGSIEDLWAFNEEIVAEAIFESRIPIICAVGHETDHCIAEYVADVRAPTPSAAAEIVIAEKGGLLKHVKQLESRLEQVISHQFRHYRQKLNGLSKQPCFASPYYLLAPWIQKLDIVRNDLDKGMEYFLKSKRLMLEGRKKQVHALQPLTKITHFLQKLQHLSKAIDRTMTTAILDRKKERLEQMMAALGAIDPKNLLGKGYSIVFSQKDHSVISSIRGLTKNDQLEILFSDGKALTTLNETMKSDK